MSNKPSNQLPSTGGGGSGSGPGPSQPPRGTSSAPARGRGGGSDRGSRSFRGRGFPSDNRRVWVPVPKPPSGPPSGLPSGPASVPPAGLPTGPPQVPPAGLKPSTGGTSSTAPVPSPIQLQPAGSGSAGSSSQPQTTTTSTRPGDGSSVSKAPPPAPDTSSSSKPPASTLPLGQKPEQGGGGGPPGPDVAKPVSIPPATNTLTTFRGDTVFLQGTVDLSTLQRADLDSVVFAAVTYNALISDLKAAPTGVGGWKNLRGLTDDHFHAAWSIIFHFDKLFSMLVLRDPAEEGSGLAYAMGAIQWLRREVLKLLVDIARPGELILSSGEPDLRASVDRRQITKHSALYHIMKIHLTIGAASRVTSYDQLQPIFKRLNITTVKRHIQRGYQHGTDYYCGLPSKVTIIFRSPGILILGETATRWNVVKRGRGRARFPFAAVTKFFKRMRLSMIPDAPGEYVDQRYNGLVNLVYDIQQQQKCDLVTARQGAVIANVETTDDFSRYTSISFAPPSFRDEDPCWACRGRYKMTYPECTTPTNYAGKMNSCFSCSEAPAFCELYQRELSRGSGSSGSSSTTSTTTTTTTTTSSSTTSTSSQPVLSGGASSTASKPVTSGDVVGGGGGGPSVLKDNKTPSKDDAKPSGAISGTPILNQSQPTTTVVDKGGETPKFIPTASTTTSSTGGPPVAPASAIPTQAQPAPPGGSGTGIQAKPAPAQTGQTPAKPTDKTKQ